MIGIDSQHPLGVSLDGVEIDHLQSRMCVSRTLISRLDPGRLASRCRVTTSPSPKAGIRKEPRPNSACKDSFIPFPAAATVHPVEKSMADEEPGAYMPRSGTKRQATVAADGSGDYKTVQEAIDALSENGGTVLIKPGTYREVVHIAKPHVRLQGLADDPEKVVIVYSNSAYSSGGTFHSATAFVTGDDFYADNMTFQNNYSRNHGLQPQGSQAIALSVRSDRAIFRNVHFLGAQDTLFASSRSCQSDAGPCIPARQYFYNCYIEGNVDFIFGDAEAVFDHCHIHAHRLPQGR